jgi:sugar/nucleoside kinase (ribokinase family)
MAKIELLCFGNAIVDVFTEADSVFMERFGIDGTARHIDRKQAGVILKELNLDPSGGGVVFGSGGGAANVAKIAAMLGMNSAFAGCVGRDSLAAIFEKDLANAGAVSLLKRGTGETGVCFVFGGQKAEVHMAASPGAALEFSEADLEEDQIAGADVVVLDGYVLDRTPLVRRLLCFADRRGIPVALDAASVMQVQEKTEEILQYSRNYPLLVFMNADEAIAFFNRINRSAKEDILSEREKETMILRDVCPMLKVISDGEIFPIFVIKMGGRGAVVVAGGNVYREETFAIKPRNAVGAGDAFCAAFLSAWIRGRSLSECAALGNKVAREILEVPGTQIRADKLRSFARHLRVTPDPRRGNPDGEKFISGGCV